MYAYVAEFLGTLLLISVISFVGNPYAIGAALTGAILLVGSASGGHFNPAVSMWAFLSGKITGNQWVMYVVAQAAAAIVAVSLKSLI